MSSQHSRAARISAWGKTRYTNLLAPMYKEGSGCRVVADFLPGQLCSSQVARQEVLTLRSLWAVPVLSQRNPNRVPGNTRGEQPWCGWKMCKNRKVLGLPGVPEVPYCNVSLPLPRWHPYRSSWSPSWRSEQWAWVFISRAGSGSHLPH